MRRILALALLLCGGTEEIRSAPAALPKVRIAYTFDDGPVSVAPGAYGDRTGKVLDFLKSRKAKGTFFVEHSRITKINGQKQLLRMTQEGHEIGIHGVHPWKHHLSWAITYYLPARLDLMIQTMKVLPLAGGTATNPLGQAPKYARPPGGESTLKANLKSGKVTSSALTNGEGTKWCLYDQYAEIQSIFATRGVSTYLGPGTSGANSWLVEVPTKSTQLLYLYSKIESEFVKAKTYQQERRIVILSHDIRSFDSSKVGEVIDKIRWISEKHGVEVTFETMSSLTQ